jgi:membrane protease YdiL (CAAX protease family)
MTTAAFRGMKPFAQLMFALFIMIASVLAFMMIGFIMAIPFLGIDGMMKSFLAASTADTPEGVNFLKYFQVLQSIGLFVVPPFILGLLYHGNIREYLQINRTTNWQTYIYATLTLLVMIPFINFLGDINGQMKLPEMLSGLEQRMQKWEDAAKIMVDKFMIVESISGLLFNIFMIAVLPALGEELMFRGVIQRIFSNWTKNHHWGIWIAAFLFSAMHMQFYGFLPRMALGAMFGYLLVWTGTMWVPILAHFVNNTMGVLGYYLINKGVISKDVEEFGSGTEQLPLVIFSIIIVGLLLFAIWRIEKAKIKMPANQIDSQASRID